MKLSITTHLSYLSVYLSIYLLEQPINGYIEAYAAEFSSCAIIGRHLIAVLVPVSNAKSDTKLYLLSILLYIHLSFLFSYISSSGVAIEGQGGAFA